MPGLKLGNMRMAVDGHMGKRIPRRKDPQAAMKRHRQIARRMRHQEANPFDHRPGETPHRQTVLTIVVVAKHGGDVCQRAQFIQNARVAYIPRMDDVAAIRKLRIGRPRQPSVRIR